MVEKGSSIAGEIDSEFRRMKSYKNKKRKEVDDGYLEKMIKTLLEENKND